eukprot:gnl/Ergobibamus_cyprinoides/1470.p1 GENE.gnl/Ergobibamus_cyprinoides/1470~~gnl/Ergobibamus_cyprinoides/1470.p1  ORF type:complete len:163 (-),score=23.60 gnl/Ergobibamus_cyprinoides/1470:61-549(-)
MASGLLQSSPLVHRILHFLGVADCPNLLLAHPSLYDVCLAAPSISTTLFLDGDETGPFLPSVALDRFHSLRHLDVTLPEDLPEAFGRFCRDCVARDISLHVQELVVRPGCPIPACLRLSVDALVFRHDFPTTFNFQLREEVRGRRLLPLLRPRLVCLRRDQL